MTAGLLAVGTGPGLGFHDDGDSPGQGRRQFRLSAGTAPGFDLGLRFVIIGRRRGLVAAAGAETEQAAAAACPAGNMAQMLGHVGHRLGCSGKLAAPVFAAGFKIAARGPVQVSRRLQDRIQTRERARRLPVR